MTRLFHGIDDFLGELLTYITQMHATQPFVGYRRTLIRQVLHRIQNYESVSSDTLTLLEDFRSQLISHAMPSISHVFFGLDSLSSNALQALDAEHNLFLMTR